MRKLLFYFSLPTNVRRKIVLDVIICSDIYGDAIEVEKIPTNLPFKIILRCLTKGFGAKVGNNNYANN